MYNTGSERMIGVLIFTGSHYDTVAYSSDINSGGGSSLFPAGCAVRLNQAVAELLCLDRASREAP